MMLYSYFSNNRGNHYSTRFGAILCLIVDFAFGIVGYIVFRKKEF